jgi:hypothetical protein
VTNYLNFIKIISTYRYNKSYWYIYVGTRPFFVWFVGFKMPLY